MAKKTIFTCDRCKKEINMVPKSFYPTAYVDIAIPETSLVHTDFYGLYQKINNLSNEQVEKFGTSIEVSVGVGVRTDRYDLCSKCRKKLIKFIEEGQNG